MTHPLRDKLACESAAVRPAQCVLFTHDETLYSVFVPGLRKSEFEQLDEVFGQRLFKALRVGRVFLNANRTDAGSLPRDPLHALQQPQRAGLDE